MSLFKVVFDNQSATLEGPISLQGLNLKVNQLFGVKVPGYSYVDEDSEMITVDVQLELNEAIRFLTENQGHLTIIEKSRGSNLQFIEDLPLLRSQITTDDGNNDPNPIQPPNPLIKLSENSELLENVKSEYSEESINDSISEFEELKDTNQVIKEEKTEKPLEIEEKNCLITEIKVAFEEKRVLIEEEKKKEEEDDFPEIFIEKEEIEFDLALIRSVIREEVELSRSGRFAIHDRACFHCKIDPIVGSLFKCRACYFILCEICEEKVPHEHPLLKLKEAEKSDRVTDMAEIICRQLKESDLKRVKEAVVRNQCDYARTLNYLLE